MAALEHAQGEERQAAAMARAEAEERQAVTALAQLQAEEQAAAALALAQAQAEAVEAGKRALVRPRPPQPRPGHILHRDNRQELTQLGTPQTPPAVCRTLPPCRRTTVLPHDCPSTTKSFWRSPLFLRVSYPILGGNLQVENAPLYLW